MEIFIIAAQTADGFIAKDVEQNSMNWTSGSDKKFFIEKTKKAGVVVMGRKTYETIGKPLPNRRNIVLSKNVNNLKETEKTEVEIVSESPRELVERLEKEGEKGLAICGGASVYTSFLQAGVVNKIYLTIEPVVFGNGIKLFSSDNLEQKLELVSSTELGHNAILLEYNVINK